MSVDAPDLVHRSVARDPTAVAVRTRSGEERTYEALAARADAVAGALHEHVGAARVATLLDTSVEAIEVGVASLRTGVGHVPLNTRESPGNLRYVLDDAGADALVFDDANAETAAPLLSEVSLGVRVGSGAAVDADTPVVGYEPALADAGDVGRVGEEFGVFYTSGSTGRPKGVAVDAERMWDASVQATMEMGHRPDDVALTVTPLFHLVTPASWTLPHLQVGATLVPVADFDPDAVLDAVEAHGVTELFAVPAQLDALAARQAESPRDLSTLRQVRTGGAPLARDVVEATRTHLTPEVHNTYGLTEAVANLTHAYPAAQDAFPGTVGRASYNWEVRVVEAVDPEETPDPAAEVAPGEAGELLARGPPAVDGYLDGTAADDDLFVDGWLRSGDVAAVNDDGTYAIVDRVDNMLVSGGENVYPQEVERVLDDHPAVESAAVVGAPHPEWGTAVVAVVVGDATADDLDAHCRDHPDLADFKRPRAYRFADELPRSPIGKFRREEIRERYGDPVDP